MRRLSLRLFAGNLDPVRVLRSAVRHPGTPWLSRVFGTLSLVYLLSPVDFIPAWFPVLGQMDDLILVPAGLLVAYKLIPRTVWQECRAQHAAQLGKA